MNKQDLVIIWLSVQITVMTFGLFQLRYDLGFERGKVAALTMWDNDPAGECLAPGGCDANHDAKPIKRHK